MIEIIPANWYGVIFLSLSFIFTVFYYNQVKREEVWDYTHKRSWGIMYPYAMAFIVVVGLRPLSGVNFGDTVNYAHSYLQLVGNPIGDTLQEPEWIYNGLMWFCAQIMPVQYFFLLIEILYVLPIVYASKKLAPNYPDVMLLFNMTAFSFFSYGTNGIRNGMACSLMILALAFMNDKTTRGKVVAILLAYVAYGCHKSTALPILCMVFCLFFKNTKVAITFWVLSIFISLVAGGAVESFFTGLGFDDRMESYSSDNINENLFSHTGFRWDFLLYSFMPIWLGWYIVYKRNIRHDMYSYLLNSYILCNSFWVMMIRASYSNRFAYLSWFLYPVVLAYPLLKFPVFETNNKQKVALILLAHTAFTIIMSFKS